MLTRRTLIALAPFISMTGSSNGMVKAMNRASKQLDQFAIALRELSWPTDAAGQAKATRKLITGVASIP